MRPIIVAMTGASGVLYGIRLIQVLAEMEKEVNLVISDSARLVLHEELEITPKSFHRIEDLTEVFDEKILSRIKLHSPKDFTASIASGSYPTEGMIIIPCSMGTLGAVANGISQNLIHRAADCTLKEGRKLVIVPRETPLNAIHLENMLKLSRLGVSVVPAMPAFYSGAQSIQDIVDFMVGKVLDQFGLSHALYPRWTGTLKTKSWEKLNIQHEK